VAESSDAWRLAFDVGPVRAQPAGVGTYAASVAEGLAHRLGARMTLIGAREGATPLDSIASAQRLPFHGANYHAWLQRHADGQARRAGADICHYTNAAAPLLSRIPFVVTVHDLSLVRMPSSHPMARRLTVPIMLATLARARAIVVPSEFTRSELARIRVSVRRVTVIAHAPSPSPPPAGAIESRAAGGVLARLGLYAHQYVLTVGTIEPRKNLARLVAAFERVAAARPGLKLVLVGAPGWHYEPILARIERSAFRDRIVVPGYQSPGDLDVLIRNCGVSAYVSVYEGFGMPVLDAMARGAPVVASDRTAMPEAAGGAALLVDPLEPGAIAHGLAEGLEQRERLSAASLARAASRSWADVADEHLDLYRWVLEQR
jgi:alpha-1,3-rhamnosyl/mannosyltransferase